jgi:hypothetical protein
MELKIHSSEAPLRLSAAAFFLLPLVTPLAEAQTTIQNFAGFADSTVLTNQISGLTFTNATILTSGISLNELQYPPYSGSLNVVSNPTASSITITFATPVPSVSGYYTYSGALTVQAYSAAGGTGTLLATSNSRFSNNTLLNGASGSSANELITVSSPGIASIVITSAAGTSSFTLSELIYGAAISVPTLSFPAMTGLALLLVLLACFAVARQTRAAGMAAILLLAFASAPTRAAAFVISAGTPNPQNIPVGVPTQVTFPCTVQSGFGAIANSVTLLRSDTTPPTLLGYMTGGPNSYSLTVSVTATSNNQNIPFQCTVGVGTSTVRIKSNFVDVNQPLP